MHYVHIRMSKDRPPTYVSEDVLAEAGDQAHTLKGCVVALELPEEDGHLEGVFQVVVLVHVDRLDRLATGEDDGLVHAKRPGPTGRTREDVKLKAAGIQGPRSTGVMQKKVRWRAT